MTPHSDSTSPSEEMGPLLDRSAPTAPADDALRAAITAMVTDARVEAGGAARAPRVRSRAVKLAVIGTIAAAIVGAGGVAVAASLISWGPEYANPDTEFSVTLPSGRMCEARYVVVPAYPDGGPEAPVVNQELQAWLSAQDFANVDLAPGERLVAQFDAEGPNNTLVIAPDGSLADVAEPPSTRTEDDTYVFVLRMAVNAEMRRGLEELGMNPDGASLLADIKCEPVVE